MRLRFAGKGILAMGVCVAIAMLLSPHAVAVEGLVPRFAPFHGRLSGVASQEAAVAVASMGSNNVAVSDAPDAQNEPSIAVNPTNPKNWVAGANDYRFGDAWPGVYTSKDGGKSWKGQLLPGYPGGPTSIFTGTYTVGGDPSVSFGPEGRAYYAGIVFNRAGFGSAMDGTIFVARSDDGGNTWDESIVARGHGGLFHDHEQITADGTAGPNRGSVYVSWTAFQGGQSPIVVSRSTDGGVAWSAPLEVSGTVTPGGFFQDSVPAVGPDGTVYVVWDETFLTTGAVTSMRIWLARSTDGGATFSAPMLVANPVPEVLHNAPYRHGTYATIGVGPTGRIFVAWADNRLGDADILLATSDDAGVTWSSPVRVNDDPLDKGTDQFFPWLSVAPSGRVDIGWYDKRVDPNNYLLDFFVASTYDGKAISANRRASDVSSDPAVWPAFIGDYNGIASTDLQIRAVWTDTRNGQTNPRDFNEDIYTALLAG